MLEWIYGDLGFGITAFVAYLPDDVDVRIVEGVESCRPGASKVFVLQMYDVWGRVPEHTQAYPTMEAAKLAAEMLLTTMPPID